jgi:hypothetical protein
MLNAGDPPLQRQHFRMRRDVAEPVDAGGFQGGVGVEALGDGAGDEGLALLGQPVQQRALLLDQPVDARRFLVQKPRYQPLRVERGSGISMVTSSLALIAS